MGLLDHTLLLSVAVSIFSGMTTYGIINGFYVYSDYLHSITPIIEINWKEKASQLFFGPPQPFIPFSPGFAKWFGDNGGYVDPCLSYKNGGMYAKNCAIEKGSVMIVVPEDLVLSHKKAMKLDSRLEEASRRIIKAKEIKREDKMFEEEDFNYILSILSMFIALNKDIKGLEWRSNFFAPYITSLPKTCQTLTCSTNTTARLASHTYAFERALEGKRKNLLSYLSASGLSDVISEGDYLVAVSVVESRAWPPGLLPGIDLLNHHEKGNAIEFNLDEKENVAKSFQRVEVGGEVFDSYGGGSSGSLTIYQNYGFLPPSPQSDTCLDLIHLRHHPDQDRRRGCLAVALPRVFENELRKRNINLWEREKEYAYKVGDNDLLEAMANVEEELRRGDD